MRDTPKIESLIVLLTNGHTYDVDPSQGPLILELLLDREQEWMKFSTVDGKVVHIAKAAIIGLENPKPGHPVPTPMGFSADTALE